jgi:hypothetical protein
MWNDDIGQFFHAIKIQRREMGFFFLFDPVQEVSPKSKLLWFGSKIAEIGMKYERKIALSRPILDQIQKKFKKPHILLMFTCRMGKNLLSFQWLHALNMYHKKYVYGYIVMYNEELINLSLKPTCSA